MPQPRYTISYPVLAEIIALLPDEDVPPWTSAKELLTKLVWRVRYLRNIACSADHEAIGYLDALHDLEAGASIDDIRREAEERLEKCAERGLSLHRR
jgi:hypothetical protein